MERENNMYVNSVNFCATIPATKASEKLNYVLILAKDYDYGAMHTDYLDLCKYINKFLPNDEDTVTFKNCIRKEGPIYNIEGDVCKNGQTKPFSSTVNYHAGSNLVSGNIVNSIRNVIK